MNAKSLSRRQVLRGAGVALSLPFLETFSPLPSVARAASARPKRYVALWFPNGTASYWAPTGAGTGDAWKLSPILEPLLPVKEHVTVLGNVSNYSPFGGHVEPSHSNCGASTWTCVRPNGPGQAANGISIDQAIAKLVSQGTPLPSLQVGLSTRDSSPDGLPGQHSRSMSWKSATEPLYKIVNPQAVFDRLVSGTGIGLPAADQAKIAHRRALKKSALDAVLDVSKDVQKKISSGDRARMDQFFTSVRSLETRTEAPAMQVGGACKAVGRPPSPYAVGNVPLDYNRGEHANLMIDLVVMAFECDLTRVVSFMLDDARSDFVYNFLKTRTFSATGSTPGTAPVGGYHDLQHAGEFNNGFATIGYWNAEKAAQLAGRLAAVKEVDGSGSILDNTVITFASGMKGGNHDARNLPIALIGSGGKVLKTDQYVPFASEQRLADVHLTVLQQVFGSKDGAFGASSGIIPALLA